jgi:DNA (cytosine-5)-methyltransferase 1
MKILDLCCGGGGASRGIELAGHTVEGVDKRRIFEYRWPFIEYNAIDFLKEEIKFGPRYDAYFADPGVSRVDKGYRLTIDVMRGLLLETKRPFVLMNSKKNYHIMLCGTFFNLDVFRHRHFEISGFDVPQIKHEAHIGEIGDGKYIIASGHGGGNNYVGGANDMDTWREALGIDWKMTKSFLGVATPPSYTKYIFSFLKG